MAILDMPGAERLIGNGDMLLAAGTEMERLQGAHVSSDKTERNVDASCEYENPPKNMEVDVRFKEAVVLVVITQNASVSELQRKLGLGDVRANRIMNQLEAAGVVGPNKGPKGRDVLITDLDALEKLLEELGVK
jgi:S-DNA-T family DNA segregation ATPase FtsK/SpoIIIE